MREKLVGYSPINIRVRSVKRSRGIVHLQRVGKIGGPGEVARVMQKLGETLRARDKLLGTLQEAPQSSASTRIPSQRLNESPWRNFFLSGVGPFLL